MSEIVIQPGLRSGRVTVPWSKSYLHRLMIADFLAGGNFDFSGYLTGDDVCATHRCLQTLSLADNVPVLECGESGSTLRFLLPVAMTQCGMARFCVAGRLSERPISALLEQLRQHGVDIGNGEFPVTLRGQLNPGSFALPGDVSSQFITGLLLALPILPGDSSIELLSPLESAGYVEITRDVLRQYGIRTLETETGFFIPGGQQYVAPKMLDVERDWSSAAVWITMNYLGARIICDGMNMNSLQPDSVIENMLGKLGQTMCVSQCPDLFPVLAIAAGAYCGKTVFTGIKRLSLKESDRLAAMERVLAQFGIKTKAEKDEFYVWGTGRRFIGNVTVPTRGDHRIAMATAIGAMLADGPVAIQDYECVQKSYPDFWTQYLQAKPEMP